ncbi:hypothetical protein [Paenibacillus humicola]|uniref:hypothetical protein n=1 Tax=Paenibacillus humicola TaxID=3110540 RepID=UPI00237AC585|nr:hypothetical protein [Paenibacillus humicola]
MLIYLLIFALELSFLAAVDVVSGRSLHQAVLTLINTFHVLRKGEALFLIALIAVPFVRFLPGLGRRSAKKGRK